MDYQRLSICTGDYDRIQALKTGRALIDGCDLDYLNLDPGSTFQRLFRNHEFDIAEMSFSTYMLALTTGDFPYVAVPVFLSRVFPHGSIYVRTDRGIDAPADLHGKKVGIPSYHFTRGLVVRGMLSDSYGVQPQHIRWLIGGIDRPEDFSYVGRPAPAGVEIAFLEDGRHLGAELAEGRIDAIISYRDPQIFTDGTPAIARLFPDFRTAEQAWFRETGIFPAMHVVGIRRSLVAAHPWLPRAVCDGFADAKRQCEPALADLDALKYMLPWLAAEYHATRALMGDDFWPYGVPRNGAMIAAQTRWSYEQGLSPRVYSAADLFEPSTLTWNSDER